MSCKKTLSYGVYNVLMTHALMFITICFLQGVYSCGSADEIENDRQVSGMAYSTYATHYTTLLKHFSCEA